MATHSPRRISGNFSRITLSLTSPEQIQDQSFGEVNHPETINYRTLKPEMGGLFCERIFGPIKDWECHCGKFKRIRYRGTVCERCGVEVTEKKVRRERAGHIKLAVPVAHIWYFRSLPNKIGYLLGLSSKKLDQIIYYERYVVIQAGAAAKDDIKEMDFLSEEEYLDIIENLPKENQYLENKDPNKFIAHMGAEALELILQRLDLENLSYELRNQASTSSSQQRRQDAGKRLRIVEAFREANLHVENRPEWMILRVIPVIPPDLRPLVPLDGGRFASSDLNDLYRRVIIRNNRLRRLVEIKAPEVILRNEKRMLQESVDSLFDNSRKVNAVRSEGSRTLRSLSDVLKGKQGRFRQNLLGKRVDYSGRSVIVVGPELKLHECGLPKDMAAELFKPFIIRKLMERGIVRTVKSARKIVENKEAVVWEVLENVLKGHPVLLNRAPTLHRLGIQAFQPKMVEGRAIQLHPLTCTAFNADFDGDQMAVHVPLGSEAVLEASLLMLSSHNILNPTNGSPITVPSQDMVLGLYYLTKGRKGEKGADKSFYSPEEVIIAINEGVLSKHAFIKVRVKARQADGTLKQELVETVAGRVVFSQKLPESVGFINELLTKKSLQKIIGRVYKIAGMAETAIFLDKIKDLGFLTAYHGGLSIGLGDIKIPDEKEALIESAKQEVEQVRQNYLMGLITDNERYNQVIDIWTRINSQLTETLMKQLGEDQEGFNSVYMMMHSGARGSREQVRQLSGMRGLMAKPQKSQLGATGEIIEDPILSNFKEGLDVIEYFISTHGARKGLADTALKTADAGYLTRRLVDVAQDVIINEEDCGSLRGLPVSAIKDNEEVVESLAERILGRVSIHDIYDPRTTKLILPAGEEITEEIAQVIEEETRIEEVEIRSVLTCETHPGVCAKCYGRNLARGRMVELGEAVGVIAAQSIGEPGTQLTLRTFHVGGTASNIMVDASISAKFEGKIVFNNMWVVRTKKAGGGTQHVVMSRTGEINIEDEEGKLLISNHIPYGAYLKVQDAQKVSKGEELCYWDPYNAVILSEYAGTAHFHAIEEGITYREEADEQTGHREKVIIDSKDKTKNPSISVHATSRKLKNYSVPVGAHLMVDEGTKIHSGQILAKIPRMASKSRDITGGLPRVTELFEARNPSNPAIVSEIDGYVKYGSIKRGNQEITVQPKIGDKKTYQVSLSKHILVQDNDYVRAGMLLCDGSITPSDILAIKGPMAVQEYLVNEIQEVYRLQGVKINDKHIEVIVRQMMQKVEVVEGGDTHFLTGQTVGHFIFRKENDAMLEKRVVTDGGDSEKLKLGQMITSRDLHNENSLLRRADKKLVVAREARPAVSKPTLQGITRASLDTESFISAASFQETTKVLSEASIRAKTDGLKGLKENVIVGHLVPAGTGMPLFRKQTVYSKEEYEALLARQQEVGAEGEEETFEKAPSMASPPSAFK